MAAYDYLARQDRLRAVARERGVELVALVPGANMVYFTGLHFHLSERPTLALIFANGGSAFICPELEYTKLADKLDALDIRDAFRWTDADGYDGAFKAAGEALGMRGALLGMDDMTARVFEWLAFTRNVPGLQLAAMGQDLLGLRAIKTAEEVDTMRRAVALTEAALSDGLATVRAGITERELAATLSDKLAAHGSEGHAFSPSVLFGENSALPHGVSGDRELRDGDILLIDFGGTTGGYPADITRTFVYGTPSDEVRAMFAAVEAANAAGRAAARPGVACGDVDKAARDAIVAAGYGDAFIHRTGHGLGLEVHELPQIAPDVPTPLAEGMVFTVEPGVYVMGVGGVRIEDDMVVTADGATSLTTFPRGMTIPT
jgi:Xaa-Pro dipeptidase